MRRGASLTGSAWSALACGIAALGLAGCGSGSHPATAATTATSSSSSGTTTTVTTTVTTTTTTDRHDDGHATRRRPAAGHDRRREHPRAVPPRPALLPGAQSSGLHGDAQSEHRSDRSDPAGAGQRAARDVSRVPGHVGFERCRHPAALPVSPGGVPGRPALRAGARSRAANPTPSAIPTRSP